MVDVFVLWNISSSAFGVFLNLFSAVVNSYLLYSNYFRSHSSAIRGRPKHLNATMSIYLAYHAISSAINALNNTLYVLGPGLFGIQLATTLYQFGVIMEFMHN